MRPLIGAIPAVDDEKTTSVLRAYINAEWLCEKDAYAKKLFDAFIAVSSK